MNFLILLFQVISIFCSEERQNDKSSVGSTTQETTATTVSPTQLDSTPPHVQTEEETGLAQSSTEPESDPKSVVLTKESDSEPEVHPLSEQETRQLLPYQSVTPPQPTSDEEVEETAAILSEESTPSVSEKTESESETVQVSEEEIASIEPTGTPLVEIVQTFEKEGELTEEVPITSTESAEKFTPSLVEDETPCESHEQETSITETTATAPTVETESIVEDTSSTETDHTVKTAQVFEEETVSTESYETVEMSVDETSSVVTETTVETVQSSEDEKKSSETATVAVETTLAQGEEPEEQASADDAMPPIEQPTEEQPQAEEEPVPVTPSEPEEEIAQLIYDGLPSFGLDFEFFAFMMEMFDKIEKVTFPVEDLKVLPFVGHLSIISPVLQCLYACESFRVSVGPHMYSQNSPMSQNLSSFFNLMKGDDLLIAMSDYPDEIEAFLTKSRLRRLMDKLELFGSEVLYSSMSPTCLLEMILAKIVTEYRNAVQDTAILPFFMNTLWLNGCQNCSRRFAADGERVSTMVHVESPLPQHRGLNQQLEFLFHPKEMSFFPQGSNCCRDQNLTPYNLQFWPSETKLKIISCANKFGHRCKVSLSFDSHGIENNLKAFLVQTIGGITYSCVFHQGQWYAIKDSEMYLILDIDFFLERGHEIYLCFYEAA